MAEGGSARILDEIQILVSDKLQVISYKWLSRNFSVSSNDAKRILQEFVEKHGNRLEVIYTLSGWLKNKPQVYHIRLVSGVQLSEVKCEFEDSCSVQIYSVQTCIPKDPVVLWSAEFVQAEELFNQPATVDNCLRDNRFCGVSNSFVKRYPDGKPEGFAPPKNGLGVTVSSKTSGVLEVPTIPQPRQGHPQQPNSKSGLQSSTVAMRVDMTQRNAPEVHASINKPNLDKQKASMVPANHKKDQNEKSSSRTVGSLTNMWGRASAKSNISCPPPETTNDVTNDVRDPIVNAEAQICSRETLDGVSSDDDGQDINYKRDSNGQSSRKRRVVFDLSDDEDDNYENVVSLGTPQPPKEKSLSDSKCKIENIVLEKKNLNVEEHKEDNLKIKQQKTTESNSGLLLREDTERSFKHKATGISLSEKTDCGGPNDESKKDKRTDAASTSPKRRKVCKTRIDEKGREVTEVVWEGGAADSNCTDKNATTKSDENRPPVAIKAPASGNIAPSNPVGKAGNKKTSKGGGKDANQGTLLSFFKKT